MHALAAFACKAFERLGLNKSAVWRFCNGRQDFTCYKMRGDLKIPLRF